MITVEVDIELHTFNAPLPRARRVEVIARQWQLFQLLLQLRRLDDQINQRAKKHVAADAAKQVEV